MHLCRIHARRWLVASALLERVETRVVVFRRHRAKFGAAIVVVEAGCVGDHIVTTEREKIIHKLSGKKKTTKDGFERFKM